MWRLLQLLALAVVAACGRADERAAATGPARRIASLSPALTATVAALGWTDRLVGCTPWCGMGHGVPVVGSLLDVDLERLAQARPDLVLVQRTVSGPPAGLTEAARRQGWRVAEVPCTTLQDVRDLESAVRLAVGDAGSATQTEARWSRVLRPLADAPGQSPVVLLFGVDPPQAFGAGTYLADVWAAWGGRCLPDAAGHPSLRMEDLSSMPLRGLWVVGGAAADAPGLQVLASRGVAVRRAPDPALLRPGPQLLEAVEAWRSALESGVRP